MNLSKIEIRYDYGKGEAYTYDTLGLPVNVTLEDTFANEVIDTLLKGDAQKVLNHVGKVLAKDDYEILGTRCGYEYKGVLEDDSNVPNLNKIPTTFFHSTASWLPVVDTRPKHHAANAEDVSSSAYVQCSYYTMHLYLQRQLPTFARVRQIVLSLRAKFQDEEKEPCLDDVLAYFPGVAEYMVKKLYEASMDSAKLDKLAHEFFTVHVASRTRCFADEEGADMCGVPGNKKTETLTEQAKRLSAELYQNNCNDLGRCYSDYNHKMGARPVDPALGNQRVLETTKTGLSIALRRGLNLLVYDYKTEILRRDKELSRTQSESVPATSEDVDLERKYEHLPLSELITADTSVGIKSFTDEEFVSKTWATVVKASELVQRLSLIHI